ncbi:MAG: hypothetical protein Tsb0026_07230 [Sulfuricaulis sp.]
MVKLVFPGKVPPWIPSMSHNKIPDFTETKLWAVRSTLKERYGKAVEPQLADTEVMLGGAGGMAWCPALFWSAKGANFAVVKLGIKRFRAYFYYHPEHQLGAGIDSYDEIGDCMISVLQVEADHMRKQKIITDQKPAKDGEATPDKPDTSPLFWGD